MARQRQLERATAFNLGEPDDYRVPDGGLHRARPGGVFVPTAAAVIEVLSPGDETFAKFASYAAHGVEEVFVADPAQRTVRVWRRAAGAVTPGYEESDRNDLLGVTAAWLTGAVERP